MHRIDRYLCIFALGVLVFAGEFIGGIKSHSLSLVSDAFHVLTDLPAVIATIVAEWLVMRHRDKEGFDEGRCRGKFGIVSAALLTIAGAGVLLQAMERLTHHDVHIETHGMLLWTLFGLVANGVMWTFMILGETNNHCTDYGCAHDHADLSHRALVLHIATDFGQSVVVLAGGTCMAFGMTNAIDGWMSVAIGALMIFWSWSIARSSWEAIQATNQPRQIQGPH